MLPKSFLLLALLLGVTLLHTNRVVADDGDQVAEGDEPDEGEEIEGNRRSRAPKTCIHEWEAWMCPKGIIGVFVYCTADSIEHSLLTPATQLHQLCDMVIEYMVPWSLITEYCILLSLVYGHC